MNLPFRNLGSINITQWCSSKGPPLPAHQPIDYRSSDLQVGVTKINSSWGCMGRRGSLSVGKSLPYGSAGMQRRKQGLGKGSRASATPAPCNAPHHRPQRGRAGIKTIRGDAGSKAGTSGSAATANASSSKPLLALHHAPAPTQINSYTADPGDR